MCWPFTHEVDDGYVRYYNKVYERYMYAKICPICGVTIYLFEKKEFLYHKKACAKKKINI